MKIQVGANDGQTISIDLQKIDSSTLGLKGFAVDGNSLNVGDSITSVPQTTGAPKDVTFAGTTAATLGIADTNNLSLHNILDKDGDATGNYVVKSGSDYYAATLDQGTGVVTINTSDVTYTTADGATATKNGVAVKVANDPATGNAAGFVTVDGKNYKAGATGTGTDILAATDIDTTIDMSADTEFAGASTNDPLALLDKAIASVDKFRSSLGAVQNRLDSAVTNLNNTTTNLSEAQSRIQDADYATDVSNMSKAQIIQQAGNSVLSKANQVPQQVLSLLQG